MGLGEKIYKLRTEKNLSQGDLAEALGVSRQSISKWETNGSVPELDKLVKLSEVFGVTLDELILDKQPAEAPSAPDPKIIYVERSGPGSTKKNIGIILLCFAAMLWLVTTLYGGFLEGLMMASPFVACGLICLLVRKNTGLWCLWTVYLFTEIYLRFATGINWNFVLLPQVYAGGWTIQLIVAWLLLLTFAGLTIATVFRFRKVSSQVLRKSVWVTAVSWCAYILIGFLFSIPPSEPITDHSQIVLYRITTSVSGWVRNVVLVVAIVFTVRLVLALHSRRSNR